MSAGWSGPDPSPFLDLGADYELGTRFITNTDITIDGVRVWGGLSSNAQISRRGRIWSAGGATLALITLPDQIAPGWNVYPLDAPLTILSGTVFWVSYSVNETYGAATAQTYPKPSADGAITAQTGGLNNVIATFPDNLNATVFYGVDIDYTPGAAVNQRPVVGIAATANQLTVAATLAISDETPSTVSYVIEWGDGATTATASLGPHAHTYAAAGQYVILVTATDAQGLTDSAAVAVTVVAPSGALEPNSELVGQQWLKTVSGIAPGMVSTNLPRDNSTWAASGFVQVAGIVGGTPDMYGGRRNPVVSLDLWGNTKESALPPWGKASRLGELIMAACFDEGAGHVLLDLGSKYKPARVMSAIALSEPRRIPGDKGGYAHYQMDVQLSWTPV